MKSKRVHPRQPEKPADKPEEVYSGKLVRLELDPRYHIALRVAAAERGLWMSSLARMIIKEWLESQTTGAVQLWLRGDLSKEGSAPPEAVRTIVEALKKPTV